MKANTLEHAPNSVEALRYTLQGIVKKKPNTLQDEVASRALEYHDPEQFFQDLMSYGCISGMAGGLAFYSSTHAFYDRYYHDIEEIREEYESSIGQPIVIQGDLKNFYAWFAFEETAYRLAVDELALDL